MRTAVEIRRVMKECTLNAERIRDNIDSMSVFPESSYRDLLGQMMDLSDCVASVSARMADFIEASTKMED